MNAAPRSTRLVGVVFLVHLFVSTSFVWAQGSSADGTAAEPALTNATCPVLEGEAVDPDIFTEYEGRRVHFCCRKCLRQFLADPAAYAEQVAAVMPASLAPDPTPDRGAAPAHDDSPQEPSGGADSGAVGSPETTHSVSPLARLGRLHVVTVHFPIALLLLAALLEAAGSMRTPWRSDATVRLLVAFGAIAALTTAVLGLVHGYHIDHPGSLAWMFWWHRALGLTTAAAAVVTWTLVERRHRAPHGGRTAATAAVLLAGALVAVTGHFGGSLVFGWDFLLR